MSNINQKLDRISQGQIPETGLTKKQPQPPVNYSRSAELVTKVLTDLKAIFGGWPASIKTQADEAAWKKGFVMAMAQFGIASEEQIKKGLRVARSKAKAGEVYLPSGAKFAGWCEQQPEDFGLCGVDEAYRKVIARDWESLHPAFQHIVGPCLFDLRYARESEAKKRFASLYQRVLDALKSGQQFERILAVERKPKQDRPFGREAGKKALKDCMDLMKGARA